MGLRYGEIPFRSSSVRFEYIFHGIGGRRPRPPPKCLPLRIVLTKLSSVQLPIPVTLSGVRFVVNDTPHGPDHAVFVALIDVAQPSGSFGPAVIRMSCG